jgi:hypothetical protein
MKDRKRGQEGDDRAKVYDLLGELTPEAVEYAKQLLVMAGQQGAMVGGYFFEKASSSYLHGLAEVPISDTEGHVLGNLPHEDQVFRVFYSGAKPPEWMHTGEKYIVGKPKANREDRDVLWKMSEEIRRRLKDEGREAANEFLLMGTSIGGVEEDREQLAQNLTSQINALRSQLK